MYHKRILGYQFLLYKQSKINGRESKNTIYCEMIYIYYSMVRRLEEAVLQEYINQMPFDTQNKIMCFHRWQDAHACLIGRLLLIEGLKNYGFDSEILQKIKYTPYGRPYLKKNIDFNIAHSEDMVICGISNKTKIGIDTELVRPIEIKDFKSQLRSEEWSGIMGKENIYKEFYSLWTKKEAVIKADGRGLFIPLNKIILKDGYAEAEGKKWNLINLNLNEYEACLATDAEKEYVIKEKKFSQQLFPSSLPY